MLLIPKDTCRKGGVLSFYLHESLTYKRFVNPSDFEWAIVEICFNNSQFNNFYLVYRPHVNKVSKFFQELENRSQFMRKLKYAIVLFGDFNIDSLKHTFDKRTYENVLSAYDYKRVNSEPTRLTPTSSTCIDHLITFYHVEHKTINATISDHFLVLGKIPGFITEPEWNEPKTINARNLKKSKVKAHWTFCSFLDQNLEKLDRNHENFLRKISKTILEGVDKFAFLATVKIQHNSNDWILNENKDAITKKTNYFNQACNRQVMLIMIRTRGKRV